MTKHYYTKTKKNVEYVIELCACFSYLNLKRYLLNDENVPSYLWVGTYIDVKTCVKKAKINFNNSFNEKEYQMTIECDYWKKIPISMRNVNKEVKEVLKYAE